MKPFEARLADVVALPDPVDRLRALDDLIDEAAGVSVAVRRERTRAVREIRDRRPRPSWGQIGSLLGISGERARQLADDYDRKRNTRDR